MNHVHCKSRNIFFSPTVSQTNIHVLGWLEFPQLFLFLSTHAHEQNNTTVFLLLSSNFRPPNMSKSETHIWMRFKAQPETDVLHVIIGRFCLSD